MIEREQIEVVKSVFCIDYKKTRHLILISIVVLGNKRNCFFSMANMCLEGTIGYIVFYGKSFFFLLFFLKLIK